MNRKVMRVGIALLAAALTTELWSPLAQEAQSAEGSGTISSSGAAKVPQAPTMIAGKPYLIEPGKESGTFVVKWGDSSMVWKPKPWMEPALAKSGPAYLAQWSAKGLTYPYELPVDQRDQLPAGQYLDRCFAYGENFPPDAENQWDEADARIYLPDGSVRTETNLLEIASAFVGGHGRQYMPAAQAGQVARIYKWTATKPEELRGQGGTTTVLTDPNLDPQDTLYLPTVRRTRRLAGAVAKQYFPGTIYRYEDVSYLQALPQLNYKIIGFELFNPPDTFRGYGQNDVPQGQRIGGAGDVNVIIEITPKPGVSWWYAKRIYHCGLIDMHFWYSEEFDANGTMMRRFVQMPMTGSKLHLGKLDGPPASDLWTIWGYASVQEFNSGFVEEGFDTSGGFNAEVPTSVYAPVSLERQSMTIQEWLE